MILTLGGVDFEIDEELYEDHRKRHPQDPHLTRVGCEMALETSFVREPPVHGGPAYPKYDWGRAKNIADAVEQFGMDACRKAVEEYLRR